MSVADSRIPVHFAPALERPGVAGWLVEGDLPAPGPIAERFGSSATHHPVGCACCLPRSAAAQALGRLFLRRARGEVWFERVEVVVRTASGRDAVAATLTEDVLVKARFRSSENEGKARGSAPGPRWG